jgi:murein DD-endopeptidase MepM/ murein hydrolase activator NlpD
VKRGTRTVTTIVVSFCAGVVVDSWLRVYGPPHPAQSAVSAGPVEPTITSEPKEIVGVKTPPVTGTTGRSRLRVPIDGVTVESMKGGFAEGRPGHPHEAVDMLAPRNTPVHAADDGTIAKLFLSKAGGLTIYQFDPSEHLCYYYAHLQRYADDLREGATVRQGEVIGYVGTSGNAPPNTPHLHFAIFELGPDKRWWHGKAVDPYVIFARRN